MKGKKTCSVQKDDPSDAKEVPKIFFATSLRQLPSKGREKNPGTAREKKSLCPCLKKKMQEMKQPFIVCQGDLDSTMEGRFQEYKLTLEATMRP